MAAGRILGAFPGSDVLISAVVVTGAMAVLVGTGTGAGVFSSRRTLLQTSQALIKIARVTCISCSSVIFQVWLAILCPAFKVPRITSAADAASIPWHAEVLGSQKGKGGDGHNKVKLENTANSTSGRGWQMSWPT